MTKIGKKLAAVLLAAAMVMAFMPVMGTVTNEKAGTWEVHAAEEYPDISNAGIDSEGMLNWDEVPGADRYVIMIDSRFFDVYSPGFDLKDYIDGCIEAGLMENTGSHSIKLYALNVDETLASWIGTYTYTSPYSPVTVGAIGNVIVTPAGLLTWDAYPKAESYWVCVERYWYPADSGYDLNAKIDELVVDGSIENSGAHTIEIVAYNDRGTKIAEWAGTHNYTSSAVPVVLADIQNAKISDGILTWDVYPGATEYWVHINGISRPGDPSGYQLHDRIDTMIQYEGLEKNDSYQVRIEALDADHHLIAYWETTHAYASSAEPVEIGVLKNVKVTDGLLTWNAFPETSKYWVGVNGLWRDTDDPKYSLSTFINEMFLNGTFPDSGTFTYKIEARDASDNTIAKYEGGEFTYTVSVPMADVEVSDVADVYLHPGETRSVAPQVRYLSYYSLTEGTDYTYKLTDSEDNVVSGISEGGTYYAVFDGLGIYKGQKKVPVHAKKSIAACVFSNIPDQIYTGAAIRPDPHIRSNGTELIKDRDFTVTFDDNVDAGLATAVVEGKGDYWGTHTQYFYIKPKAIKPTVTLSASSYTWNGKARKPAVTVKDGSKKLAASDYTVTYMKNKNVGKASAVVTLKGNYSGSKTVSFKINPKGTSISKLTKAKKAATVKWKKQAAKMSSSRITGYQILLATNSKFTKNKKTVNVKGYSKTSKKVTKLKGGKKYYVKIRTYKTVGGTKCYSPWSKVKTVKTKK